MGSERDARADVGDGSVCAFLASNTIVVEGRAEFREQVRAALAELCPCYIITITSDGEVTLQSPVADRPGFCKCYCAHIAGCNLVQGLSADPKKTRIKRTGGGNRHRNGTVSWNPEGEKGGRDEHGDRERPPSTGLAHELIHAQHTHGGSRGQSQDEEEDQTTRDENQIRREKGEPMRTHYGRRRVANPSSGRLDTRDRAECGCQ